MKASVTFFLKTYIKKPLENGYWWLYGSTVKQPSVPVNPRSFLFICKGNVCRSVFAQGLAEKIAAEKGIPIALFDSAGLEVTTACPPPKEALRVAKEFGVALDGYRSKRISREMAESFDMVIAMEARQVDVLERLLPQQRHRIFLLPLFDDNGRNERDLYTAYNIRDPFGEDFIRFRICYRRIERCLICLFKRLYGGTQS